MRGELFKRKDGKFSWRVRAENRKIIATDGAQGYENRNDAKKVFRNLFPDLPLTEFIS